MNVKALLVSPLQYLRALLFGSLTFYGCRTTPPPPPPPPMLVVIGADISKTFEDNSPLQSTHIRTICDVILSAGNGGMVVFQTIGDPTKKDPLRLEIEAIPNDCSRLPAGQRVKCKNERREKKDAQKSAIEAFITQCTQELQQTRQLNTDINGFFRITNMLLNGPAADNHNIFVYLHSDGIQDLKGNKALNCNAAPQIGKLCASGWTNPEKCNISHELATPDDFILLLKKEIKKQSSKSKQQ